MEGMMTSKFQRFLLIPVVVLAELLFNGCGPTKTGGGGMEQLYDPATGQYIAQGCAIAFVH
jgi:hypothetical protein